MTMGLSPAVSLWALPTILLLNRNNAICAFQLQPSSFVVGQLPSQSIPTVTPKQTPITGNNNNPMTMILETSTQSKPWDWKSSSTSSQQLRRKSQSHYTNNYHPPSTTEHNFIRRGPRRHNNNKNNNRRKPSLTPREANERYALLLEKTRTLLDLEVYPLKSLVEEKWHYSMMRAWSKLMDDSGSVVFPIPNHNPKNSKYITTQSPPSISNTNDNNNMNHLPTIIDLIHQRLSDEHQSGNTDIRLTSELTNTALKACATTAPSL